MKTSSPISKNKTQCLDSQKTPEKSTNKSYKTNINTILKQDNHNGTNMERIMEKNLLLIQLATKLQHTLLTLTL